MNGHPQERIRINYEYSDEGSKKRDQDLSLTIQDQYKSNNTTKSREVSNVYSHECTIVYEMISEVDITLK